MQADLPKTINDAVKILAYNDYFWVSGSKSLKGNVKPHPKDYETVHSLAEAQYAWTEKQAKLAVVILKRYLSKFQSYNIDISDLVQNPKFDSPFRVINFAKSIDQFIDEDEIEKIELKFPYNKKIIQLVRTLKDTKSLPAGYSKYDGESKTWTFIQSDVTTYYLTLLAIRYDFEFINKSLLDTFEEVKKEKLQYKRPTASIMDDQIVLKNGNESLTEYWATHIKNKSLLEQLDTLKNFGISTKGLSVPAKTTIGKRIAHHSSDKLWIDSKTFSKHDIVLGLLELNCFPIIMPISGDIQTTEDVNDWREWINCFEKHGISSTKHLSFGFDLAQPVRTNIDYDNPHRQTLNKSLDEEQYQFWFDLHQLSKQFKYIDSSTKVIFARNRIPRSLIRSGIKPKASLVALGGGYYAAGTDNLKRLLDNLPKKLYYSNHQPSNYDWYDKIIIKL
tara:strand:+ start:2369 stop:3709 length:1341 start_codon:yes stop_codon:yes gene_type:complete